MSFAASTVFKVGCRVCRKITHGRCPTCATVAYCSAECQAKDAPHHAPSCAHSGTRRLESTSPLSNYQQSHEKQWKVILLLCQLGADRGCVIVVHDGSDYVGLYDWANLKLHIGVPEGSQHSIKASMDSAKADQHNIVVVAQDGGYYHARFAIMVKWP
jgi:hypothetical protein